MTASEVAKFRYDHDSTPEEFRKVLDMVRDTAFDFSVDALSVAFDLERAKRQVQSRKDNG